MKILNQIVITDNIKLIRIKQDFDEEELKMHLKKLKDKEIEDYLGFSENIEEEIEDIKGKIERKTNIYYAIYKQDEFIGRIAASIFSMLGGILIDIIDVKQAFLIVGLLALACMVLVLDYMRTRFGLKPEEYEKKDIELE